MEGVLVVYGTREFDTRLPLLDAFAWNLEGKRKTIETSIRVETIHIFVMHEESARYFMPHIDNQIPLRIFGKCMFKGMTLIAVRLAWYTCERCESVPDVFKERRT